MAQKRADPAAEDLNELNARASRAGREAVQKLTAEQLAAAKAADESRDAKSE